MPATIVELVSSRTTSIGQNARHDKIYTVTGTDDEADAIQAVYDEAPDYYGGTGIFPYMPLRSIGVEPTIIVEGEDDKCRWTATAGYSPVTGGGSGDEEVFQFNTGGSTKHITQSIETRLSAKAPADPDDIPITNRAINQTLEQGITKIDGTDIAAPSYAFSETHFFSDAEITPTFKNTLCDLTGTVNNATFKGFAAYEVLFLGASGMRRGTGQWEVTFSFQAQKNQTDVSIGGIITIPTVRGWEYVWVVYDDDESEGRGVKLPKFAYVEKVYRYTDFSALGLDP